MSNALNEAQQILEVIEAHVETLLPKTEAHFQGERVRDNLSACIAMGKLNPKAAEILLPNVLSAAKQYAATIGN